MSAPHVLMILTSHKAFSQADDAAATGVWFEELTAPYYLFQEAGVNVTLASIQGGEVPIDPHSLDDSPSVLRFQADTAAMQALSNSLCIDALKAQDYDAIFLPGGHGTMWDCATSTTLAALLTEAWAQGKILGAVCHGPAGLLNVKDTLDQPLVAGRRISAFTNTEEALAGKTGQVPFLLETALKEQGALHERTSDFAPLAVVDGLLVTGQNPASSAPVAEAMLALLNQAS
ncbi:type 1 glutamine amidotransferase domain-containing protein [Pokkaliibacter sp. CJK22405]|uniref:type 1 glutamine amidotransferase domain-containing protein n=1 Tax=Pokkaliibacter sp. CJK22405 TaxID=3384615 RepID=UPI0039856B40